MTRSWIRQTVAVLITIAITTTMDASGLAAMSTLPLLPLALTF